MDSTFPACILRVTRDFRGRPEYLIIDGTDERSSFSFPQPWLQWDQWPQQKRERLNNLLQPTTVVNITVDGAGHLQEISSTQEGTYDEFLINGDGPWCSPSMAIEKPPVHFILVLESEFGNFSLKQRLPADEETRLFVRHLLEKVAVKQPQTLCKEMLNKM
jgi:hypothetical protein